jgi:copper chaperone CopZ
VPGVSNVEFEGRRAIVTYDPAQTTPEAIARAIETSGVDQVSAIEPLTGQEQR